MVRAKRLHDREAESTTLRLFWFQSLTLAERMQLLVEFSDLVLQNHPRMEPVDAQPTSGVFASFQSHNVRYVVIGGIAAVLHGVPRATFDLDILIGAPPVFLDTEEEKIG